jgi:hypothetical protein
VTERDPLGVVISSREIYDEIVGMREDVRSLSQHNERVTETLADHEDRIRGLERWKYALPVAAVTSAGTLITAALKATGKV